MTIIGKIPAGFWRRVIALIIDSVIMMIPYVVIMMVMGKHTMVKLHGFNIAALITFVWATAYYILFLSSSWQATPGKRLMSVYVVNNDGSRISRNKATARWVAYMGPSLIVVLLNIANPGFMQPAPPTEEDMAKLTIIYEKLERKEELSPEEGDWVLDRNKMRAKPAGIAGVFKDTLSLVEGLYLLALALTVAGTDRKTGIHDMMCKTRAIVGRVNA